MNILKDIGWGIVFLIMLGIVVLAVAYSGRVQRVRSITWDPSAIASKNVSISIIEEVNNNPHTYELVEWLSTSTPNTGRYDTTFATSSNQYTVIGCIDMGNPCMGIVQ